MKKHYFFLSNVLCSPLFLGKENLNLSQQEAEKNALASTDENKVLRDLEQQPQKKTITLANTWLKTLKVFPEQRL